MEDIGSCVGGTLGVNVGWIGAAVLFVAHK